MAAIDLNADLGETVDGVPTADDEAMFAVISSASIACGGHAGDAASMRDAVDRAARFGVAVGAHPSYPDPANFGRRAMDRRPAASSPRRVAAQLRALVDAGADIRYVKPHGALYHAVSADAAQAGAVVARSRRSPSDSGGRSPCSVCDGEITARRRGARAALRARGVPRSRIPRRRLARRRAASRARCSTTRPPSPLARCAWPAREWSRRSTARWCAWMRHPSACTATRPPPSTMARAVRAALDADGIEVRAPW